MNNTSIMHINPLLSSISILDKLPMTAVVPILIVMLFAGVLFVVWALTKRYKRIAPNIIGIIYGKKSAKSADGKEVGFKLVTGGGVFIWPIFEEYAEMSTEAFQIGIEEDNVPTRKNVGVYVAGVATCRVSPVMEEQINAVQNFLGKTTEEMQSIIAGILRGHLRSIVGSLEVEELLRERSKFNTAVINECTQELARMGIKILTLVIQDVKDKEGYIEALGKQAIAGAKRDALIATAEAERESTIKSSDAQRAAAETKAQNDALIKEAEKKRDMQVAQFKMETASKQAEADMAGQIAKTGQEQRLAVLVAERDAATAQAQTKVQVLEASRKQEELKATLIVKAEADAKALSIKAQGEQNAKKIDAETRKQVATLEAETAALTAQGVKNAAIQTGEGEARKLFVVAEAQASATLKTMTAAAEGEKAKLLASAEGNRAQLLATAEGNKAQLLASAEGERAQLLATAEGNKAQLLAVAEGERAKLLAQAEGNLKQAEALKQLNEVGKFMFILDRMPGLLDHGGDAGAKIAKAIMDPVAAGVSKIGNVQITDLGGGNAAKNGIANMGTLVPQIVVDMFTRAKASGVDMSSLLQFCKMDPAKLAEMLGPQPTTTHERPITVDGETQN